MLVLGREQGERVVLIDNATRRVIATIEVQWAIKEPRLAIDADRDEVTILREELVWAASGRHVVAGDVVSPEVLRTASAQAVRRGK